MTSSEERKRYDWKAEPERSFSNTPSVRRRRRGSFGEAAAAAPREAEAPPTTLFQPLREKRHRTHRRFRGRPPWSPGPRCTEKRFSEGRRRPCEGRLRPPESHLLLQARPHLSQLKEPLCRGAAEEGRDLCLRADTRTVVFSRSSVLLHDATVLFIVFIVFIVSTAVVIGGVFALVFRFSFIKLGHQPAISTAIGHRHGYRHADEADTDIKLSAEGAPTLRAGSPSRRTAARATAPSERTRQSPKLITCTFLRGGVRAGLTRAMASVPRLVKVLSLKLRTRSSGLCCRAAASATTPAWLMPFWGMWTSSRLPIS
ncbi:hypothetical protein EYF80_038417 [Liparis tanakae]|uniref:Uncharacterized protein n=1 Tax=Liparis tanakae TaxID=230148 RepID=A0A4Z2GDN5_9TELE|nr:hypothetical protein EYF80_038417 [Liparis tanakae]